MANGVSVEKAAIDGGIGCCKTSVHALKEASKKLKISYQQAGSKGWKDQKYAALGGIVEECCNALTEPVIELEECMCKLNELLKAVNEYDQVGL